MLSCSCAREFPRRGARCRRARPQQRGASALEPGQRGPASSSVYASRSTAASGFVPPPVPPVPVPFVRRRLDADAGKTKADATAAIRACALKEKAPSVWQGALVDLFLVPSRVVQEREIPPDVQGCCCGASLGTIPLPVPVPVPASEAFEEPPAPTPAPVVMITSTTMTTAPYSSTTSTSTTAPMVMTTTTTMTTAPYSSTTSTTAPSDG